MKYYSLKSNYCPKSELLCQRHAQIIELQTLGHKCLMGTSQLVLRVRLFYFLQKSDMSYRNVCIPVHRI